MRSAAPSGQETTLLAINGLQQTMASWFPFLRYITRRSDLRMVLFDFPGQGRGRIDSGDPSVSLEEHLAVLHALAQEVAPGQKIYLIGGSWGGVLAAAYAARFPDQVSKLVLGSFRTNPNEELQKILAAGQKLFEEERLEEVAALLISSFGRHLSESLQEMLRQQFAVISMDHLRHLYAQTFYLQGCKDIAEYVNLGAIQADTLIVNGAKDPIVDPKDTEKAAARIPRCRFRILPDVGHFLHMEKPEVMDVYREFLLGK